MKNLLIGMLFLLNTSSFCTQTELIPAINQKTSSIEVGCSTINSTRWGKNYKNQDNTVLKEIDETFSFFGIFDGHGESNQREIPEYIRKSPRWYRCQWLDLQAGGFISYYASERYPEIMEELHDTAKTILGTNNDLLKEAAFILQNELKKTPELNEIANFGGTTACMALINKGNNILTTINIGDSRLVVIRGDALLFTTIDHSPDSETELERLKEHPKFKENPFMLDITKRTKRINGLAVSRTFGDFPCHDYGVIAEPEINHLVLENNDVIVIASDGLWDVVKNEQIAEFISENKDVPANYLDDLADCLASSAQEAGSKDDITVQIIRYKTI